MVAACCGLSERQGVRPGMTISQAKALLRGSVHEEAWDAALLAKALRWLALKAVRFTPKVATDAATASGDGLWLDITGCTHLFGGRWAMIARIVAYFHRLGFEARAAAAPTMGAAWALARYGPEACCDADARTLDAALHPLPIAALRLSDEQIHGLHELGIVTIDQMLRIPRAELARRYGAEVCRRLDQAFGREAEMFTPIRTRPPLALGRTFAGPTDQAEPIALSVRQLLDALRTRLERREEGCRELLLVLMRSDLAPVQITVRASRPTRDDRHWYALLRPHLERAHLGYGVEGVTITAKSVRTLKHEQAARWIETQAQDNAEELARLADTLIARLGAEQVVRLRPRASFIPERAWTRERVDAVGVQTSTLDTAPPVDRPSLLLPNPIPVDVVFLFPDGPIGRITSSDVSRNVIRCRGPERISAEWWTPGERSTRDYYQLHTDDGAWLWVYRLVESGRWFLHGEWA